MAHTPTGPRGGHHICDVVLSGPPEFGLDAIRRRDRPRGVTSAPGRDLRYQVATGVLEDAVYQLTDRNAFAAADVERERRVLVPLQPPGGGDVRAGDVADVDVVADRGPVRGVVVGAEDPRRQPRLDALEDHRDDVQCGRVAELR